MAKVRIKRGTRAQIEAAAALGALVDGEPYLITDERRIAVGVGAGAFSAMATQEEVETFANVAIRTPSNALPLNMATGVAHEGLTLVGSPYNSLRGNDMAAMHVQVSTVSDFATRLIDSGDIAGTSTSYSVATGALPGLTTIYWRVRYKDVTGEYSAWSGATSFTTAARAYIVTPAPTPTNFGDPFEGGFYKGLVWNELVQSSTSLPIETGSKVFIVPNMDAAPIVYVGQLLEARSRANPSNKMVGTVVSASGGMLTLSITSVGGAGTFSDWSIMARYRYIVAPKASGEHAGIALKNTNTAFPTACQTLTEGWAATQAMVAAGDATTYPAAHWVRGLNIGGRTDWFIDARDTLELSWRNLKPTATANYITANRAVSTLNYQNLGSYGGSETTHGTNKNSSPAGTAYTADVPGQTGAAAFRTGGAEAYEFGTTDYWSVSEFSTVTAWNQYFQTGYPGYQHSVHDKSSLRRVRAVRRSII